MKSESGFSFAIASQPFVPRNITRLSEQPYSSPSSSPNAFGTLYVGRANLGKFCPKEKVFFFWEVIPDVIAQEFPLPTRADAARLFCFSLHQHFHHGDCIFLFFIFCFISLDFVTLFGFCSFVWCFIFQDYFLCNPSKPLQPFIAPLRGKSLWKARKETSSVRISFLVFKFSLQFF